MSQTEVIFIPTDNTIVSAINTLVDLSKETKVPVVGSDAGSVEKGVLFTYGTNYEALGRQTGKLAGRVLRGEKVKDVDAEYPKTLNVVVNHDMAKELGIDVSSISDEESKASTQDDKPIAKKIRVSLSLRSISLLKRIFKCGANSHFSGTPLGYYGYRGLHYLPYFGPC